MFSKTDAVLHDLWQNETEQALEKFIRVPSLSPMFDSRWEEHGYLRRAVDEAQEFGKFLSPTSAIRFCPSPERLRSYFSKCPPPRAARKAAPSFFTAT